MVAENWRRDGRRGFGEGREGRVAMGFCKSVGKTGKTKKKNNGNLQQLVS